MVSLHQSVPPTVPQLHGTLPALLVKLFALLSVAAHSIAFLLGKLCLKGPGKNLNLKLVIHCSLIQTSSEYLLSTYCVPHLF